ncbi:hypothetical protein [Streptomyces arenae]|uniref:hypothetical protein n=1 Tax=Streptomyces arenae TaxID=29301 RepID=UPI002658D408|nr:hypothetical protein [Streptomyces arenae]MCG7205187.1 hypothetical protein [Streptomyces arenae]
MSTGRLAGPEFVGPCTQALQQVFEARREDRELSEAPEPEQPAGRVFGLLAALQECGGTAMAWRAEDTGAHAQVHEMLAKKRTARTPVKKTAAKKTTAKKTAVVKKTAAKEATARRPRCGA